MVGGMLLAVGKNLRYCVLFSDMWDDLVLSLDLDDLVLSPFLEFLTYPHTETKGEGHAVIGRSNSFMIESSERNV